ncbi:hypothetical protein BN1723_018872, partial [Verticillium longisporum]
MGLRDFLRKKDGEGHDDESNHDHHDSQPDASHTSPPPTGAPEFKFVRSESKDDMPTATAASQLSPSSNSNSNSNNNTLLHAADPIPQRNRLSLDVFSSSRSRSGSVSSQASNGPEKSRRRISERLHLSRAPSSSEHVPQDLPAIVASDSAEDQWERRATMLANMTERARSNSRPPTPPSSGQHAVPPTTTAQGTASSPSGPAATPPLVRKGPASKDVDEGIQEAIRLHEEGHLAKSTAMFAWLADPKGANNPLSQVLYGLALRHGWGCEPDVERGVTYLTAAASNAATVEQLALQAGLKKGGAYKGELVLAIFELGNSFRHGWGTAKDPVAAKQYYETAANLGDTDAMNEAAWCYVEGFGCKKDKVRHTARSIVHPIGAPAALVMSSAAPVIVRTRLQPHLV